ncbi:MAG: glycosyltransferase family 4 protein [Gammaproteobacteria bacterium]|nr:MAG: glycosyltransferase family 4 protein [Gammaproteobacteria bacterium]
MTPVSAAIALLAAFITGLGLTAYLRHWATQARLLDLPNARSSHRQPTPRGGGLAIASVTLITALWLATAGRDSSVLWAIIVGGTLIAWIGWLDDRAGRPWWQRFAVHVVVCIGLAVTADVCVTGSCNSLGGWLANIALLAFLGTWSVNLFNFMDGIDGLAGTQAVFSAGSGAVIGWLYGAPTAACLLLGVSGAATLGFLWWNWPPAKIFMGDVGSGFLGFVLFAVPLWMAGTSPGGIWPWVVLWAVFAADASVTLVCRILRGERPHEAHRCHLYQQLAVRWNSHGSATLLYLLVNLLWVMPLAFLAAAHPNAGFAITATAYLPLVLLAWYMGAGAEPRNSRL